MLFSSSREDFVDDAERHCHAVADERGHEAAYMLGL